MADTKISNLTAYTTPQSTDVLPIVDISGPTTKKITYANLVGIFIKETPSGAFNGSNLVYTLTHTPIASSGNLYINGQVATEGVDYSVSGTTLTLVTALPAGYANPFIFHYKYTS